MKRLILIFLFAPSFVYAEYAPHNQLSGGVMGCYSFFEDATCIEENFSEENLFRLEVIRRFADEKRVVYTLEMRLYEAGYLLSEPLHWRGYLGDDPTAWNHKYLPIIDGVKFTDY